MTNILKKIDEAGLVGRGGASYPTAKKWAAVAAALKRRSSAYIIVNGAEGEPGVKKDGYLFQHHAAEIIDGVYQAAVFLGVKKVKKIYFFLNHDYYHLYAASLRRLWGAKKYAALNGRWDFFIKPARLTYISGEETALLNLIEGQKVEPRLRPPYPPSQGLFGQPTLINNPETFYDVSLVARGKYRGQRFYTISGAVRRRGVYALPAHLSIEEILRETGNYPDNPFFVQVGGEASGEVLNQQQLAVGAEGSGSITVYDLARTSKDKLLKYWLRFYRDQSCGQCTICREGTYRLDNLINAPKLDDKLFWEIVDSLSDSSFCALGYSLPVPIRSFYQNILKK